MDAEDCESWVLDFQRRQSHGSVIR